MFYTAQTMKFSIKDFFSKCDNSAVSCRFGHIYWRNPEWKTSFLCSVTQQKKEEEHLYYSITGNFAETAKAFNIIESTVLGMIKDHPVPDNMKLSSKCNFHVRGVTALSLWTRWRTADMDFGLTGFAFPSIRFESWRESKACYTTSQLIIFCQPWLDG